MNPPPPKPPHGPRFWCYLGVWTLVFDLETKLKPLWRMLTSEARAKFEGDSPFHCIILIWSSVLCIWRLPTSICLKVMKFKGKRVRGQFGPVNWGSSRYCKIPQWLWHPSPMYNCWAGLGGDWDGLGIIMQKKGRDSVGGAYRLSVGQVSVGGGILTIWGWGTTCCHFMATGSQRKVALNTCYFGRVW